MQISEFSFQRMPQYAAMYAACVVTEPMVTLLETMRRGGECEISFALSAAAPDLSGWMPGICSALCCAAARVRAYSKYASWGTHALSCDLHLQNRYARHAAIIQVLE